MTNLSAGLEAEGAIYGVGLTAEASIEHQMDFSEMNSSASFWNENREEELELGLDQPNYMY